MLRRQNLRRRHQRHLVAVLDRNDRGFQRHDRLARTDVALQQAPHRHRLCHVLGDFFQHTLLCSRGMKRQNPFHRARTRSLISNAHSGLCAHLRRFSSSPSSRKKNSSKISRNVCRSARFLQPRSGSRRPQASEPAKRRDRDRSIAYARAPPRESRPAMSWVKVLQHTVNDASKPSRREPPVSRSLVNRHDAPDLERLPLLFSSPSPLASERIVQNLKLRLEDLEAIVPRDRLLQLCRTAPPACPARNLSCR